MKEEGEPLQVEEEIGGEVERHSLAEPHHRHRVRHGEEGADQEDQHRAGAEPEQEAGQAARPRQRREDPVHLRRHRLPVQNLVHQQFHRPRTQQVDGNPQRHRRQHDGQPSPLRADVSKQLQLRPHPAGMLVRPER